MKTLLVIPEKLITKARRHMPSLATIERVHTTVCLSAQERDIAMFNGIPAQNCAGIFRIANNLADTVKSLSSKQIKNLEIETNPLDRTVKIKDQPKLTEIVNDYVQQIPELFHVFTKRHEEKDLAQHSLSTLKEMLAHPEFATLSPIRQQALIIATPLHDIGKIKLSTIEHADESVAILKKRFKQMGLPEMVSDLALKVIKHHHYSYHIKTKTKTFKDYARLLTHSDFKMVKILTTADIQSKPMSLKNARRKFENSRFFEFQEALYKRLKESGDLEKATTEETPTQKGLFVTV